MRSNYHVGARLSGNLKTKLDRNVSPGSTTSTRLKRRPSEELMQYYSALPLEERDERWEKIRRAMAREDLDCLVIWGNDRAYGTSSANMRYCLGVVPESASGGIGVFFRDADPVAFLDYPNYYQPYPAHLGYQKWVTDIRPVAGMEPVAKEIRKKRLSRGRIGLVSHFMASMIDQPPYLLPHYDYEALRRFLPSAELVEATKLMDDFRMIKSPREIQMLERSGRIAGRMVDALVETARPGVRENEVWAKMAYTLIVEGGEGCMFNQLASGSIDSEWRHLLHGKGLPLGPTSRPLGDHDVIVTEFHSNYGGYLTGVEFTVLIGSQCPELEEIHSVAVESLQAAVPRFRPGAKLQEVIDAMRKPVKEAGFSYIELGFHGHGLSSPEYPTYVYSKDWPYEAGEGMKDLRFQENMVFGINIDIHNPKWRDDIGVMFGDTVVVSDPPRLLAGVPLELPLCK